MQKYRRREAAVHLPLQGVVEAVQLTHENVHEVVEWTGGQEVTEIDALDSSRTYVGVNFKSWDGMCRASEGDYIIKDGTGTFHNRWPIPFEENFEEVNDASQVNLDHAGDEPR